MTDKDLLTIKRLRLIKEKEEILSEMKILCQKSYESTKNRLDELGKKHYELICQIDQLTLELGFKFYFGQILEGDGLKFRVVSLNPTIIKCLEVSDHWRTLGNYKKGDGSFYKTWEVGSEYPLEDIEPNNIHTTSPDGNLPWHIFYVDGRIQHYR